MDPVAGRTPFKIGFDMFGEFNALPEMGDEARDIVGKREADACRSTELVGEEEIIVEVDGGVEEEEERANGFL